MESTSETISVFDRCLKETYLSIRNVISALLFQDFIGKKY